MLRLTSLLLLAMIIACASVPSAHDAGVTSPLLDGQALFGVPVAVAPEADILGVSAEP